MFFRESGHDLWFFYDLFVNENDNGNLFTITLRIVITTEERISFTEIDVLEVMVSLSLSTSLNRFIEVGV